MTLAVRFTSTLPIAQPRLISILGSETHNAPNASLELAQLLAARGAPGSLLKALVNPGSEHKHSAQHLQPRTPSLPQTGRLRLSHGILAGNSQQVTDLGRAGNT
jgi:hypothetical protein